MRMLDLACQIRPPAMVQGIAGRAGRGTDPSGKIVATLGCLQDLQLFVDDRTNECRRARLGAAVGQQILQHRGRDFDDLNLVRDGTKNGGKIGVLAPRDPLKKQLRGRSAY